MQVYLCMYCIYICIHTENGSPGFSSIRLLFAHRTNGGYPFANGLNELNGLNGLAHLYLR